MPDKVLRRDVTALWRAGQDEVSVECPGCGESKALQFNHGNMDRAVCCGYEMILQIKLIELTVKVERDYPYDPAARKAYLKRKKAKQAREDRKKRV